MKDHGNKIIADLRKAYGLIEKKYFNNEILLPTVVM